MIATVSVQLRHFKWEDNRLMWILAGAVLTASLLGSLHCVGMCGPLAIWASGAGDGYPRRKIATAATLYHFGRLITYALAGLLAGLAGQLVDFGGQALGIQLVAARIVGSAMIVIGALKLWQMLRPESAAGWQSWNPLNRGRFTGDGSSGNMSSEAVTAGEPRTGPVAAKSAKIHVAQPSAVTRALVRLRPYVFGLSLPARGLVTGLLTALLPCGWLYLFALFAAGTGSVASGVLVMAAFWLGTVPALVSLVAGTRALSVRFRRAIPVGAAALLILGGCFTASGRGFAGLNSLAEIATPKLKSSRFDFATPANADAVVGDSKASAASYASELENLLDTPLPCCAEHQTQAPDGDVTIDEQVDADVPSDSDSE